MISMDSNDARGGHYTLSPPFIYFCFFFLFFRPTNYNNTDDDFILLNYYLMLTHPWTIIPPEVLDVLDLRIKTQLRSSERLFLPSVLPSFLDGSLRNFYREAS